MSKRLISYSFLLIFVTYLSLPVIATFSSETFDIAAYFNLNEEEIKDKPLNSDLLVIEEDGCIFQFSYLGDILIYPSYFNYYNLNLTDNSSPPPEMV